MSELNTDFLAPPPSLPHSIPNSQQGPFIAPSFFHLLRLTGAPTEGLGLGAQFLLSPSPCPEHSPSSSGASHGAGDGQDHPSPITTLGAEPRTCLPSRNYPSPVSQAGREGWSCRGMCGVGIWCSALIPAGDKGTVGLEKWGPGVTPWKAGNSPG